MLDFKMKEMDKKWLKEKAKKKGGSISPARQQPVNEDLKEDELFDNKETKEIKKVKTMKSMSTLKSMKTMEVQEEEKPQKVEDKDEVLS